jgi:hypothetical protein
MDKITAKYLDDDISWAYAARCRNCNQVMPYVFASKRTHTWTDLLNYITSLEDKPLIFQCVVCHCESLHDIIAISTKPSETDSDGKAVHHG